MTSEVIDSRRPVVQRGDHDTIDDHHPAFPAGTVVTAYAVAHLTQPPAELPEEVLVYMERVQATLAPFDGRFLVHGGPVEIREGTWPGTLVLLEFPDLTSARTWYESDAYSALRPLRTRNVPGHAILVDGVATDYDPAHTAALLRQEGHGSTPRPRGSGR